MFCRYCGQQLNDGAKFCSNCGQSLQENKQTKAEPVKAKPKVLLQIEIEDEKVNDVLKVVSNNDLYNIIKR